MTCRHFPNAPEPQVLRINGDPRTCARRLLTIHAHPDDETTKGGGSVARYAAAGVGTVLLYAQFDTGNDPIELLSHHLFTG